MLRKTGMKEKEKAGALIVGAVAFSFLLTMQTLFIPWSKRLDFNDSSIYQYIGYLITTGRTPYLDAFDHKGLYFYFLNAFGYLIDPKWGMWLIIWAGMFVNCIVVYKTAAKFLGRTGSVIISVIVSSGIATNFWDGDTPDYFAMLFNLLAFYVLSNYFSFGDLNRKQIFLSGLFTGIAFWMKPNMIAGTVALCGCLFVYFLFTKNGPLARKSLLFFAVGFIAASLPVLLWLYSKGAVAAMIEDYFYFNFLYSSFYTSFESRMLVFSFFLTRPSVFLAVLCTLALLISLLVVKDERKTANNGLLLCGVISFAVSFLIAVLPGNKYEQYGTLLYPSVALILIGAFCRAKLIFAARKKTLILAAVLMTGIVVCLNAQTIYTHCRYFWSEVPQEMEEKDYIADNSQEGDTIAIVSPYYSGLYIATNRESASKYVYVQLNHFLEMKNAPEAETDYWTEYSESLISAKPRIIAFDRRYANIPGVNRIMETCLQSYTSSGHSVRFDFYVLKRSEDESVPEFVSDTVIPNSLVEITIPPEMIEAYRRGEISFDEIMAIFDEAFTEKFGK